MSWLEELRVLLARIRGRQRKVDRPSPREISCEEALERLYEWLDQELEGREARAVAQHIEVCAHCYPLLLFERSFRESLERISGDGEAPPELRVEIQRLLEEVP